MIDTDKDGFIDYTEFVAVMTAKINVKDIFNCFEPTDNVSPTYPTPSLTFGGESVAIFPVEMIVPSYATYATASSDPNLFHLLQKITVDDIKRVAKDYDKSFSDTELHQMLIYADTNGKLNPKLLYQPQHFAVCALKHKVLLVKDTGLHTR